MTRLNPKLRRALGASAGSVLAFTAFMGFAHTSAGRPLLKWLGHAAPRAAGATCPLGYGSGGSAESREASARAFAAKHAGAEVAASRPALDFDLGVTTRADVNAWAASAGVSCKPKRPGSDELECLDLPASAVPEAERVGRVSSLWLSFDGKDKLTRVGVMRHVPVADEASQVFGVLVDDIHRKAGSATELTRTGDASGVGLSHGLLAQASAELRYRDYYAMVRATNFGKDFTITEDYRFLPSS